MGTLSVTQFVHPDGRQKEISVDEIPDDVCAMAQDMELSCECMPNNYSEVVMYARIKDEPEEFEVCMIGVNGPGEKSPRNTLIKAIRQAEGDRGKTAEEREA
jgi:hypothetical protein